MQSRLDHPFFQLFAILEQEEISPERQTEHRGDGQLAFLSRRSGKLRAYRMTAAGAEVTPLDALAESTAQAVARDISFAIEEGKSALPEFTLKVGVLLFGNL